MGKEKRKLYIMIGVAILLAIVVAATFISEIDWKKDNEKTTETKTNTNTERDRPTRNEIDDRREEYERNPLLHDEWEEEITEKTEVKNYVYTEEEIKAMGKGRDPFELQDKLKNLAIEIEKEYEKARKQKEQEETSDSLPTNTVKHESTPAPNVPPPLEEPEKDKILTKEELATRVNEVASKYSIADDWVYAIIENESGYSQYAANNNSSSGTTDRGLMQINSKTAPWLASKLGKEYKEGMEFDVETNLEMGVYYLNYLKQIDSDIDFVLTAYNRGPTGANNWKEKHGTYETPYSKKVKEIINRG